MSARSVAENPSWSESNIRNDEGMNEGFLFLQTGALALRRLEELAIRGPASTILYFATRGFFKGFALYAIPMMLLKRRRFFTEKVRTAVAVGGAVFAIRLLQKLTSSLLLTGFAGGLALVAIDPSTVNSLLISWLTTRALRTQLPALPYGSTALMCLSAGLILGTWVFAPDEVDPTYFRFLEKHGGQSADIMKRLRDPLDPPQLGCIVHPGQTCWEHPFTFWPEGFVRAIGVYAPLYVIFFLASRKGRQAIPKLIVNLSRSSAFLATYCTLAWVSACLWYRNVRPGVCRKDLTIHGCLAGLSLFFEREERRAELATYCCTYALQMVYHWGVNKKHWAPSYPLGVLLICASLAVALINHQDLPVVISDWLLGLSRPPRTLSTPQIHSNDPHSSSSSSSSSSSPSPSPSPSPPSAASPSPATTTGSNGSVSSTPITIPIVSPSP